MKHTAARTAAVIVTTALLAVAAPAALAQEEPHPGQPARSAPLELGDPLLDPDALITDAQESQDADAGSGTACSYEGAITGVNPAPASPSFQLLYVLPSDVAPVRAMDEPRSCDNGGVKYSSLARTSRNAASWLASQNAGLNYRTATYTYTHNYGLHKYSTRSVRRVLTGYSRAQWDSYPISGANGTSPRADLLAGVLHEKGFAITNTKYAALLSTTTQHASCTSTGQCSHYVGVGDLGGPYSFAVRYFKGSTRVLRYGCATDGDVALTHEQTHQLGVRHVSDHADDLMGATSRVTFKSSPVAIWDHGRDSYHSRVRASSYVSLTEQPGSYFTCA